MDLAATHTFPAHRTDTLQGHTETKQSPKGGVASNVREYCLVSCMNIHNCHVIRLAVDLLSLNLSMLATKSKDLV